MSDPTILEAKVGHPSPRRSSLALWRVFVPLVFSPLTFSAQVIASFTIADSGCTRSILPLPALVVVNLAALAALLFLLFVSVTSVRTVDGERVGDLCELHDRGDERTAFLLHFGLSMTALFVAISLIELFAVVFLGTCVGFAPSV